MAIGRTQMGTQLQGNRKMKKYQAGMGVASSPRPMKRPKSVEEAAKKKALLEKLKREREMGMSAGVPEMSTQNPMGPMPPPQPTIGEEMPAGKMMPPGMKKGGGVKKMMGGGGVSGMYGKGAMEKELAAKKMMGGGMKKGGKVRGYGKARGGKACKMR